MNNTLVLKIQYDGTNYSGWQIQPESVSIQGEIEKALLKLFSTKLKLIGSGRTDSGVHALAQIAAVKLEFTPKIPFSKIKSALNGYLPKDIKIIDTKLLDMEFNPRFDALKREYIYYLNTNDLPLESRFSSLIKYKIEFDKLQAAAKVFIGKHNFTTFSKVNPDTSSFICDIDKCEWTKERNDRFRLNISSSHFVYGQVRALVGAMIDHARGKRTIVELKEALQSKDRTQNSPFAPPQGLILYKIYYPEHYGIK